MRRSGLPLLVAVTALAALSLLSGYRLAVDGGVSWDLAVFLTPAGIAQIGWLEAGHPLAPYYRAAAATRDGLLSHPTLRPALWLSYLVAASAACATLRALRGPRRAP